MLRFIILLSMILQCFSISAQLTDEEINQMDFGQLEGMKRLSMSEGKYSLALKMADRQLTLMHRDSKLDSFDIIHTLTDHAVIRLNLGETKGIDSILIRSIKYWVRTYGEEHIKTPITISYLSLWYFKTSQPQKALELALKAFNIQKRILLPTTYDYIQSLYSIAAGYNSLYRTGEALHYHQWADSLYQLAYLPLYTHERAINLSNLGLIHFNRGDYSSAESSFLQALAIEEQPLDSATILNNMAVLADEQGLFTKAITLHQRVLKIRELHLAKNHIETANTMSNLAATFNKTTRYNQAEQLLLRAIEIGEKLPEQQQLELGYFYSNLGHTYSLMKKYDQAKIYLEKALDIFKRKLGEKSLYYAKALLNLARWYWLQEDTNKALELLQESALIKGKILGETHPAYSKALNGLAVFHENLGNLSKADSLYLKATALTIDQVQRYFPALDQKEQLSYWADVNHGFSLFYAYALKRKKEKPEITKAVFEQILAKDGLILEINYLSKFLPTLSKDSLLLNKHHLWMAARRKVAKKANLPTTNSTLLDSLIREVFVLEKDLLRENPLILKKLEERRKQLSYESFVQGLKRNSAVVVFIRNKEYSKTGAFMGHYYYALVSRASKPYPEMIRLCREEDISYLLPGNNRQVEPYYTNTRNAYELYQKLWQPLLPYLKGIKKLHISTDGALHAISFGCLPVSPDKPQVLLDRYKITYHSILRNVARSQDKRPTRRDALLVGGALFDLLPDTTREAKSQEPEAVPLFQSNQLQSLANKTDRSPTRDGFEELPFTTIEILNIADQLTDAKWERTVLLEDEAIEDNVKQFKSEKAPLILHIASHNFYIPIVEKHDISPFTNIGEQLATASNPLFRTGLVFSRANYFWRGGESQSGIDNGLLLAYEIANLDLSQTGLAILSACNTAGGEAHDGMGVWGIQTAFKIAGVDQLLLSLWPVSDRPTSEFMPIFYQSYLKGKSASVALRKAQRKMRKRYKSPRYWAPFILVK